MQRPIIIFSTITGNAFKLAQAAAHALPDAVGPYNIRYITDEVLELFDTFVLTYWCNRGTADDDTIALINRMQGKKIIIVGSLGAPDDSPHAEHVREQVAKLVQEKNILLGHYLCRGSIDLNRTARKLRIPEGQRGHMTLEHFERQKESQGHPNEAELQEAERQVKAFWNKQ